MKYLLLVLLTIGTLLANNYEKGKKAYSNLDYKTANKFWTISANNGNSNAQYELGLNYAHGLGIEKNHEKAIELYKLSAKQGNIQAQISLAFLYKQGLGTEINYVKAFELYKLSANQGDKWAKYMTGLMYFNAQGVKKNKEQACKYWIDSLTSQGNKAFQKNCLASSR